MKKIVLIYVVLFGIVIGIFHPFFKNQLITTDDSEFHAARSANYYLALKQGQLPVRWAPNLNNGYGYPVFMFNYHLPYILTTALYTVASVPFQLSLNLVTVGFVLTGATGIWMVAKQRSTPLLARALAVGLYILSPYPLITVFLRGAIGEIGFYGLLPWILFLTESILMNKEVKVRRIHQILLIGLLAAFLLTHPQSLLIAAPLLAGYCLLRIRHTNSPIHILSRLILPTLLGTLLVMWFWIPALLEKQFIILDRHDSLSSYSKEFPSLRQLLTPQLLGSDLFGVRKIVTVGYPVLIVITTALYLAIRKSIKVSSLTWFWLGWFGIGLVLMTPISTIIWQLIPQLQYMQFPWRLLWLTTFTGTMVFIESWNVLKRHRWQPLVLGAITLMLLFSVANHSRYRGVQQWPDYELLEYFKSTSSWDENLPTWASEYVQQYPAEKISLRKPGSTFFVNEKATPAEHATVKDVAWTGTHMTYTINTQEPVEVIQKTHYFPGWKVTIDNQPAEIIYEDSEFPGHIIATIPAGEHQVIAQFTNDTSARKIGDMLTLIGACVCCLYLFWHIIVFGYATWKSHLK